MLGVESGTSIFDLDGTVQNLLDQYLAINPNANFDEVYESILSPYEDKINYRTISPRLFECAAMKTCMILFKGSYQGILLPNVHYIPLEKDFSNINEVLIKINNLTFVNELLERAYEDLIKNNKYHYSSFVGEFDVTIGSFIKNKYDNEISNKITSLLNMDYAYRMIIARLKRRLIIFPGRNLIKRIYFKLTKKGNTQCAE